MIKALIIYIAFIIFSIYEGYLEAYLDSVYNYAYPSTAKWWRKYKHLIYSLVRGATMIGLCYPDLWLLIPLALLYPFWHDGFYYYYRNKIANSDIYPGGFFGYNNGSALMDFKYGTRFLMFTVSIASFIYIVFV